MKLCGSDCKPSCHHCVYVQWTNNMKCKLTHKKTKHEQSCDNFQCDDIVNKHDETKLICRACGIKFKISRKKQGIELKPEKFNGWNIYTVKCTQCGGLLHVQ